jgi:branched-chain amino acid transport system substrate-binding protein
MSSSNEQGMTRRDFVVTGGAGVAGLVIGGLGGYAAAPKKSTPTAQTTSKAPIHIGAAYPLTGSLAGDGADALHGAQMAVADINAQGGLLGRQVVLDSVDISDLGAATCVTAFQQLISAKHASFLITEYADVALAEYPIIAKTGIPYFNANTKILCADWVANHHCTNIWMVDPTELPYGTGLVTFLTALEQQKVWVPKNKTVAIISTTDPYSVNIAQSFKASAKAAGWKTVLEEVVNMPLSEWGPVLAKIRANPPDLILNLDYSVTDLAAFTVQFRSAPTQSLLYEQYGPSVSNYLTLTKDAANGVLWATVIGLIPDQRGNAWSARFQAKYHAKPSLSGSPNQYDAIMMWWTAAARAGNPEDFARVNAEMAQMNYRGNCGAYSFAPNTLTAYSYPGSGPGLTNDPSLGLPDMMFQIQNQKQVVVAPAPYTVGTFQRPPWLK